MPTEQFDIIEAAARAELLDADDLVNTWQFRMLNGPNLDEAATITDIVEVLEIIYTIIAALQQTFITYRDIRITNQTQDILLGTVAWDTVTAGLVTGDLVPPGVASLISLGTNKSRLTLRKYFGGFATASLDQNGTWTTVHTTEIVDVGAILLNIIEATARDWEYGYLSPVTLGWETPVGAVVSDVCAYQRRRKQGRGS